jgi:putative FmdB family regulatory protein
MPIYEYACVECDKSDEITRGFHDPEVIPPCPLCGYKMARVYQSPGVQFKGTGFYSTGG